MLFIFLHKEFDELQEKRTQMNEQYRTIIGPTANPGMNSTVNNTIGYPSGRPQR
jgi:hypothetical protein